MPGKDEYEIGDIHAPVEDTEVPFALKLLVVGMVLVLLGASAGFSFILQQMGFSLF